MAFIGETRENYTELRGYKVCLSKEECRLLLPAVRNLRRKKAEKAEYYEDIHDGGEATARQETAMVKAQDAADMLSNIENVMDKFCKMYHWCAE